MLSKDLISLYLSLKHFFFPHKDFQNIHNNKMVAEVMKITANSTWERQAVFLMMQFVNHMSIHKRNCFLKIMPDRLAKHSIGWKWIKSYDFCLLLLLSITLRDPLQYLSCKATVTLAGTVKNYSGPVLQMESFKSKRSKSTKAEEI